MNIPYRNPHRGLTRNQPCYCGSTHISVDPKSGKEIKVPTKYKHCHYDSDQTVDSVSQAVRVLHRDSICPCLMPKRANTVGMFKKFKDCHGKV